MTQFEFDFKGPEKNHPLFDDILPHVVEKFFTFHNENPKIYDLFEKFAYQLRAAGREYYGAKSIIERIRWHTGVETKGDDFRINNNHAPCYARLLMIRKPEFLGFLKTRKSPGTVHGDPIDEE